MSITVVLTNKSQQTGDLSTQNGPQSLVLSRTVYQQFRSLAQNKIILDRYNAGDLPPEFVKVLDAFNDIQNGKEVEGSMELLDEYLGGLGDTVQYPYSKDMIDIPPWIEVFAPSDFRNVISHTTDISGNETNVITKIAGQDYNIIHGKEG